MQNILLYRIVLLYSLEYIVQKKNKVQHMISSCIASHGMIFILLYCTILSYFVYITLYRTVSHPIACYSTAMYCDLQGKKVHLNTLHCILWYRIMQHFTNTLLYHSRIISYCIVPHCIVHLIVSYCSIVSRHIIQHFVVSNRALIFIISSLF